jgi:hypothetical protein
LIEEALVEYLRNKLNIEPSVKEDKYKIKFTIETTGQDNLVSKTEMCVRMLKVDDSKNCVEFTKL